MSFRWSGTSSGFPTRAVYKFCRNRSSSFGISGFLEGLQLSRVIAISKCDTWKRLRVKKAIAMLRYEKTICSHYVKTGYCRNEKNCRFSHNHNYLRLCPKFLQHSCLLGEEKCPLAHVLDPCRLPQCEFFAAGKCHRDDCPFLHVTYPENTPMCPKFVLGRCEQGRECTKRHVWRSHKRSGQLAMPKPSSNAPDINDAPVARTHQFPFSSFVPPLSAVRQQTHQTQRTASWRWMHPMSHCRSQWVERLTRVKRQAVENAATESSLQAAYCSSAQHSDSQCIVECCTIAGRTLQKWYRSHDKCDSINYSSEYTTSQPKGSLNQKQWMEEDF
ncbi:hypothetical protein TcWFU_007254 [Taenia crassiceps]|uniref:C3H1-type domain-containing protein n=1 Tax=Taenia crassiceps TaxID=6207 RepID=A0ABR4QS18_9CEST